MADKEVKVKVTTETDIGPLEDLDELLDNIADKSNVEVEVDDDEIADATDKTEELTSGLDDVDGAEPSIDVDDAGLEDANEKATELDENLDNIDGKEVDIKVNTDDIEKAKEDVKETESSISSLQTTIVGLVATAEIEHMATVADNMNNSWNRLELTFQNTNVTMDALRSKVSEVTAVTSQSGGVVRGYFNMMGVAGVTNVDLLASSFESLSGKAYQLDTSVESLEGTMQTMVLTGNASKKMLKNLGLEAVDLANAMGVSVDELSNAFADLSPEQRLQAITNALGDGAQANQMYGDSYEAMKNKAETAMSGLEGAIGQAILPTVIPALDAGTQAVKGLTEGFKNLPAPVQNAIGTTMGVAAIATTGIGMFGEFAGAIANLGDAYSVLKGVYEAMIPVEYAEGTAGWFSVGWIAVAIALGIALGLAFIYLYENCDWFREAVDNLGATLQWLAEQVFSIVSDNLNYLITQFENFTASLGLNVNDWKQAILAFLLFLPTLPMQLATILANTIAKVLGFKGDFVRYLTNAAKEGLDGFVNWIVGVYNRFHEEVEKILDEADRLARELPPKIAKAGLGVVGEWVIGTGESSPGYMYDAFTGELDEMYRVADKFKVALPSTIGATGSSMVSEFGGNNLSITGGAAGGLESVVDSGTVINVYGDVDSERRVQEIVDAVRRELAWNNATAGRTV